MKNNSALNWIVLLPTLLICRIAIAQTGISRQIDSALFANKQKSFEFKSLEVKSSFPMLVKLGNQQLSFYREIPNSQDNALGSFFLRRTIVYKGQRFSIDSGCFPSTNTLVGQWLDLFKCLSFKDRGYVYLFSQWYLHFTNGRHPPSLITILIFKNQHYLGCLNYLSEEDDFQRYIGYYNNDTLIDIPFIITSGKGISQKLASFCYQYKLFSINPEGQISFIPSLFKDEKNSIIICE